MRSFIAESIFILSLLIISACSNNHKVNQNNSHTACCKNHTDLNALNTLEPKQEYTNIHVEKLYSDSLSSAFVIWVKEKVRSHKHAYHTENIYVLDGTAEMVINQDTSQISTGDFLFIPKNTIHEVTKVISDNPLKVLSIQSPEFKGKDRIFVD